MVQHVLLAAAILAQAIVQLVLEPVTQAAQIIVSQLLKAISRDYLNS